MINDTLTVPLKRVALLSDRRVSSELADTARNAGKGPPDPPDKLPSYADRLCGNRLRWHILRLNRPLLRSKQPVAVFDGVERCCHIYCPVRLGSSCCARSASIGDTLPARDFCNRSASWLYTSGGMTLPSGSCPVATIRSTSAVGYCR